MGYTFDLYSSLNAYPDEHKWVLAEAAPWKEGAATAPPHDMSCRCEVNIPPLVDPQVELLDMWL